MKWIAFALLAIQGVLAQPPQKIEVADQDFTLHADTDLVVLNVGVQDSRGANIRGLAARDFKVYENGRLPADQTVLERGASGDSRHRSGCQWKHAEQTG